ncbi:hypothetical protein KGF56_004131 [Candida oxycetoniae]|uniref:Peptidase M20 dimerisation domain-containing protein n=1 Tax=Candida oxycetoniae TaxID=497107 RepID=A0AAI9SUD9_9ASCO|nr:uncharacterized protein KGF56_004131 [Candida oxycetoniae]KAI3403071.1 hypothetical protein KGF56_004131 [Candida oxycetoniae]
MKPPIRFLGDCNQTRAKLELSKWFDPAASICRQYSYKFPRSYKEDNSTVLRILFDDNFRNQSAKKLSGAVKIPTDVYDDDPKVDDDPKYWQAKFDPFHKYLNETFPLVFNNSKHFQVEIVNSHGIVITWPGTNSTLKPVLLTAHQDVVPIQLSTLPKWTYPPYEGIYDGDRLWGRGSSDCKNLLIGLLESLEQLHKAKFTPKRTIILGFGFDEEIGGERGAQSIADNLLSTYGKDSFYAVIDEGGQSIAFENDVLLALPGTGEKGSTDIIIGLNTPGGHSSVPPSHTSIGIVSQLVEALENDFFQPIYTPNNPTFHEYQCIATYSPSMSSHTKWSLLNAGDNFRANQEAKNWLFNKSLLSRYLISSSQAVDIIHGGVKSNALPEYVEIVVNHRIAVESSVNEIYDHDLFHVQQIAEKFDLGLVSENKTLREETPNGKLVIYKASQLEPAPITPTVGPVWELFSGNIRHVYEQLAFSDPNSEYHGMQVIVAPGIATGNTDTKYYWNLTKNIFRYRPGLFTTVESHAHGVDENIKFDSHLQIIAFYYEYLQLINEEENLD